LTLKIPLAVRKVSDAVAAAVLEFLALIWIGWGIAKDSPLFTFLALGVLAPAPILYFTGNARFILTSALAHAAMTIVVVFRWWESWHERRQRA
jgi:UDP-N-acetylmuramoylalanine-D-glutamate ligase